MKICASLRAAGIEVWFDQSELRGGDAWDAKIRKQIKECALFVPVISRHTQERLEGYFRLEWHLAERRLQYMHEDAVFLLPVAIEPIGDGHPRVPAKFLDVQWLRLPGGEPTSALGERVAALLKLPREMTFADGHVGGGPTRLSSRANTQHSTLNVERSSMHDKRNAENLNVKRSALSVEPAGGRASACSPKASSGNAGSSGIVGDAGRILIIEDDPTMQRVLKDNFEFSGYEVRTVSDGAAGVAAVLEAKPDLILLDIMLPRINGFDVCRRIRKEGLTIPIIMLTAKSQESDIVLGLNLGADDYVAKPFSIDVLLARVSACLRRRRAGPAEVFEFGDCRLDTQSHKLFRKRNEVPLTPKEFRLLEYFAQNAGRALTRGKILDAVWGDDLIVTERSVDRCINTLRSKVEPDPEHPQFIKTIRDVGYRFEA